MTWFPEFPTLYTGVKENQLHKMTLTMSECHETAAATSEALRRLDLPEENHSKSIDLILQVFIKYRRSLWYQYLHEMDRAMQLCNVCYRNTLIFIFGPRVVCWSLSPCMDSLCLSLILSALPTFPQAAKHLWETV